MLMLSHVNETLTDFVYNRFSLLVNNYDSSHEDQDEN